MTTKVVDPGVVNSNGNVLAVEERLRRKTSPLPDPASISDECFSVAEEAVEQVLNSVHPTLDSEEKRVVVIDYVQHLVKSRLGCEVVSYGSVPLKTYLPDGDIDLTVIKGDKAEESLAHDVLALLLDEEHNENAEYEVKETQFIDAEVKLVKCLVRGIVVDISFNQLGGLSTLCFLEQVDRLVGRNHLFKRSIIVVKTWCYYESRILGAHHGLISTYALETLVLYIFQVFHASMRGPLAVLYRFLEYYSRFDWDNYCITLKGPSCKSSLPDLVVKMPEDGKNNLLLSEEFLERSVEMFSVSSRGLEACPKAFQAKHLNIIDPLKENNNLGRSVNKGNFYRIKCALKYGARQLGQILLGSRDQVTDEICRFFGKSCARREDSCRTGFRLLALDFDDESLTASLSSLDELSSEYNLPLKSSDSDLDNNGNGVEHRLVSELLNDLERDSIRDVPLEMASDSCCSTDGDLMSRNCMNGDEDGFELSNSTPRNGHYDFNLSSTHGHSVFVNHCPKPQCYSSESAAENVSFVAHQVELASKGDKPVEMNNTNHIDNAKVVDSADSSSTPKLANLLENMTLDSGKSDTLYSGWDSEAFDSLADLTGDYDSHVRSLLCGHLCHGFASSAAGASSPPSSSSSSSFSQAVKKKTPDTLPESNPLSQNKPSQCNLHKISTQHILYPGVATAMLRTALQFEGGQKCRGTGTYFPQMKFFYMEAKPSQRRGRNKGTGNPYHVQRHGHMNDIHPGSGDLNCFEYRSPEILPSRSCCQGLKPSGIWRQSKRSVTDQMQTQINGYSSELCKLEFGSVGNLAEEMISTQVRGGAERVAAGQLIHLKNEDEFPPLCQ